MKITAIVLLALGVAAILRRRPAALRHWILACALGCAAAIPVLSLFVPAWQVGFVPAARIATAELTRPPSGAAKPPSIADAGTSAQAAAGATAATTGEETHSFTWWLAAIWIAGASFGIATVAAGLVRLSWFAARARPVTSGAWCETADRISKAIGLPRRVAILQSEHPTLLVTWGTVWPKIIIPAAALGWPDDRIDIVLRHELAHVHRRDWAVQVASELLKSIYWFNPVLWIAGRQLRLESERACDDAVVNSGIDASSYASQLVDLARALNQPPRTWLPAPAIARPSSLYRRVSAMLNARLDRRPVPGSLRTLVAVALLAIAVAVAAAQAPFATISGSVVDSTGGLIPGVKLTISSPQSQTRHEVKTDSTGRFELVGLPGGEYLLETSAAGFATARETITLSPGQLMAKTLALQVGSLQETITVVDSDTPRSTTRRAAARPASPAPCVARTVGGYIKPPLKVVDVKPAYPANLRASRAGGQVELEATIGPDGSVTDAQMVSSPNADMTAAAIEAVRQWQFTPTLLNCAPINVNMHVSVSFRPLE